MREHLVPELECELMGAESVQSKLVLHRQTHEGDTHAFLFHPLHLRQITYHDGSPVVREYFKRQVLTTPEWFRDAESTPPRRHINHLPNGGSCLVCDDHMEIDHLSRIPP